MTTTPFGQPATFAGLPMKAESDHVWSITRAELATIGWEQVIDHPEAVQIDAMKRKLGIDAWTTDDTLYIRELNRA